MRETIVEKLAEIERKEDVHILHAVESGSRAWGFASPDSDYDVRFIYIRGLRHYLKLESTSDVIEWQLDGVLDINGWDLQKALRLCYSSNPTLFEWARSPIVYKTTDAWESISREIDDFFLTKTGLHHYLHMATGNYREYLKADKAKLKKCFYVLRPLLACKWILEKKSPPPMLFEELAEAELDGRMQPVVQKLLALKAVTREMGEAERIDQLNDYLDESIAELKSAIERLPDESKGSWDRLDQLFIETLGRYENL